MPSSAGPITLCSRKAPGFDRRRAAEIFVERAKKDSEFAWNADLIELVGELPPEQSRPVLRKLVG